MTIDTGTAGFLIAIAVQTAGIGKALVDTHGIKLGQKELGRQLHKLDTRVAVIENTLELKGVN